MIGIVIVSHSALLAQGVAEIVEQMVQGRVPLATAGGTDIAEAPIGTDPFKVLAAIDSVYNDAGVLVLMDLGSALMSAEAALDMLPPERRSRVVLCEAPLVEGAVAASVRAMTGGSLQEVLDDTRGAYAAKVAQLTSLLHLPATATILAAFVEVYWAVRNARLRLVSGVPGGSVSAGTATATLARNLPSPAIGSYVMVPPGGAAWTVSVNGVAAAVPPLTLNAGSDNTLLVTGQVASPTVSLLVDDNHAPTVTAMANVRLVNGTTDALNGLTLTVDSGIVANGVVPGSASAYANVRVQAATTSHFEVSTLPLTPTPVAAIDRSLVAGGVYTVFVLGNTATSITKIWADR